jgi:hypothetical protein
VLDTWHFHVACYIMSDRHCGVNSGGARVCCLRPASLSSYQSHTRNSDFVQDFGGNLSSMIMKGANSMKKICSDRRVQCKVEYGRRYLTSACMYRAKTEYWEKTIDCYLRV